jgi:hypothetical protein
MAATLDAEAFRTVYPVQFHEKFVQADTRADGRPLGRARPTSYAPSPLRREHAPASCGSAQTHTAPTASCRSRMPAESVLTRDAPRGGCAGWG